jgi:hypothetical protein
VSAAIPTRTALDAAPLALEEEAPWRGLGAHGASGVEAGRALATRGRVCFSERGLPAA